MKQGVFFQKAFRPFFCLAPLYSVIALVFWMLIYGGVLKLELNVAPMVWHSHEMLFGFVSAIIVGFLCTASENWTKQKVAGGPVLMVLFLLWLLGRGALWPLWGIEKIGAISDVLYLCMAAILLERVLFNKAQRRNWIFVVLIAALAVLNLLFYLGNYGFEVGIYPLELLRTTVFVIVFYIVFIGQRIIPFFTQNAVSSASFFYVPFVKQLAIGLVLLTVFLKSF